MSKKHFIAIAASLRNYRESSIEFGDNNFKDLVNDLMLSFEETNPNFDRSRFIAAIWD